MTSLLFGARVRTGSTASQQSPHITIWDFDDNPTGNKDVVFDLWYGRWSNQQASIWLGKIEFGRTDPTDLKAPFWKPNELFWDDDVTPAGLAFSYNIKRSETKYVVSLGYFLPPDGAHGFHGDLIALQLTATRKVFQADLTAGGGVFLFDGKPGAKHLRNGNGGRDYIIWVGNLQSQWQVGKRPLTLGLDWMHNSESYPATDPDPFTVANRGQNDGVVFSVRWGQQKKRGDWLLGYYYAHVETLAVHASYAQDDWVRFGSPDQTDASDFQGHELRAVFAISKNSDLTLRYYTVKAITSRQDGKRFRIDFNIKL